IVHRQADASKEIEVRGIRPRRFFGYRVTVAPTSGLPPQTQFVKLPPAGPASVLFIYPMKALRASVVEAGTYVVSGRVSSPNSASIAGLRVQIVDRNVDRDVPLAETATDIHGYYRVGFLSKPTEEKKARLDLQARI